MNFPIPTVNTRFLSALSGFGLLLCAVTAGCGGGGAGGSVQATDTRAASIATVQGARKVAYLVGSEVATRDVVVGDGPIVTSLTPTLDTLRRIVRPLNFIGQAASRDAQAPTFDQGLGLYRVQTVADDQVTAQYFEDSAKTRPVGRTQATVQGSGQVKIDFDIQGGAQPTQGTLTMTLGDTGAQKGKVTGELSDPRTGRKVALDLKFAGDVMSGDIAVSSAGTVNLHNVVSYSDGHLEADVNYAGSNGHLSQLADMSGTLSLNESKGKTIATYDSNGKGTVQMAGGENVAVVSFDTGS